MHSRLPKSLDVFCSKNITNYYHMFAAGHIRHYLLIYKNLARLSNQGWEALNALVKHFFFHCTQRGGHKFKGKDNAIERASTVGAMLQLFGRRIMYFCALDGGEAQADRDLSFQ